MPYVQLTGGAYQSRSILASAQRCVNLFVETTPKQQDEPISHVHYPTPGLSITHAAPNEMIRATYRATNGDLYAVAGQQLYYVDPTWTWNLVGTFSGSALSDIVPIYTPVSISDNGTTGILCDGTVDGWAWDLKSHAFFTRMVATIQTQGTTKKGSVEITSVPSAFGIGVGQPITGVGILDGTSVAFIVSDDTGNTITIDQAATADGTLVDLTITTGWRGSPRVDFLDTYFLASEPGTPNFYVSNPESPAWTYSDFAQKTAMGDTIVGVAAAHRVVWIIGRFSHEVWNDTGGGGTATDTFPFAPIPGAMGNWGCVAPYSIATVTNEVFWLSQDAAGRGLVMQGLANYTSKRVSTHAIEVAISEYPAIDDAVGYCYQQQGHQFYVLNFPSANNYRGASWAFDATTGEWAERVWIDSNGIEYRHRAQCATEVYGQVVCGDWENANLYTFDLNNYTDFGGPIVRIRSFPHQIDVQGNRRISYRQLIANMETGTDSTSGIPAVGIIKCSFTAEDGTLLQHYSNTNDTGATFTKLGSSTTDGEIVTNEMTGLTAGDALYKASGTPQTADYIVSFNALVSDYMTVPPDGASIFSVGRADVSNSGYKASVTSNGTNLFVNMTVGGGSPVTVELGTLASGYYTVLTSLIASSITVSVYRSADGLWVSPDGTWTALQTEAIAIIDTTYEAPGRVLIGGHWPS